MIAGTFWSGLFFFNFVKFGTQPWALYVIFGACLVIGCVCGYLAVRFKKLGFFALGSGVAVVGGLIVLTTLQLTFQEKPAFLYLILALCGLVGGLLSLWIWK